MCGCTRDMWIRFSGDARSVECSCVSCACLCFRTLAKVAIKKLHIADGQVCARCSPVAPLLGLASLLILLRVVAAYGDVRIVRDQEHRCSTTSLRNESRHKQVRLDCCMRGAHLSKCIPVDCSFFGPRRSDSPEVLCSRWRACLTSWSQTRLQENRQTPPPGVGRCCCTALTRARRHSRTA